MSASSPRTVLITGASRGLGLELCRQSLASGARVFALARDPGASEGLSSLAGEAGAALSTVPCDVADEASVRAAFSVVTGSTPSLDVVVNNAGVYGTRGGAVADLDLDEVGRVFSVNTLGPLRVARAAESLLRAGSAPRIAQITSKMGSIDDNGSGGGWAYRMSKAALNMANRNLAHEWAAHGIVSLVLHPGWVRTDMGGGHAPLSPEESVAGMLRVLDAATLEQSGSFYDWSGASLAW